MIIQGDCLTELKKLPDESVNCCITSPPYNKNGFRGKRYTSKGKGCWQGSDIAYGEYKDDMNEEQYKLWQIEVLNELYRVIKPDGSVFYNHKIRRANNQASHPFEWIQKSNLTFYQQITWDRGGGPDHNIAYLDPTTELIFWLTKGTPKVLEKNKRFATEIWRLKPALNNSHPAPFPVSLCKLCLELTTKEGDVALDPFCGSGTLGIACKELRRDFIGIELNPEYIKLAEKRIANTEGTLL
jgi:site-specific DNA-methyltransferase (adenine-specific)